VVQVLVVTNMFPTAEEPWYGSFVKEQAEDLEALGVDVEIFSFDGRRQKRNYLWAMPRLREVVHRGRFQLIHAHYGLTGAVALAQRTLPVVTTFHGSDTGYVPWQGRVSWLVARRTHPVFVSDFAAKQLGLPRAPVIPVGVDLDLFAPRDRGEARRALAWREDAQYVLFPGARGNKRKRPDLFEATMREVRKVVPALETVTLERFSRQEVALVLNAVDVTLMTSDWEGSPVAVRESLACMTPVVSVPVADVPRVLEALPGCAIAERDPVALAQGVFQALKSDRRSELRLRAEETSRTRIAERVLAVYRSVLGSKTV
jgi:glycosyltransferase involved in cell wall biosynthesis